MLRFLPNPHFIPAFAQTFWEGSQGVARYIRSFKQTGEFLKRIDGMLAYLIPHYIREGKSYLTVAFGCTGGHHRSVMMAEAVKRGLAKHGYTTKVVHRASGKMDALILRYSRESATRGRVSAACVVVCGMASRYLRTEAAGTLASVIKTGEFRQPAAFMPPGPYRARLIAGVAAMAAVGLAEGLVALMITPAIDSVLNPASQDSRVPLVKLPFWRTDNLSELFFPHGIHYVGTIFGVGLGVLFIAKAMAAEYFGSVEIQ